MKHWKKKMSDPRCVFVACVAVRVGLVVLARHAPAKYLPWMGGVALLAVAGFLALSLGAWTRDTGALGQRIWWTNMRPVHATLLGIFAVMAFRKMPTAYVPLAVDVTAGAVAFGMHHFGKV